MKAEKQLPQVNCHSRLSISACVCLFQVVSVFLRTAVLTAHCECGLEKTAHSSESGVPTLCKSSNPY